MYKKKTTASNINNLHIITNSCTTADSTFEPTYYPWSNYENMCSKWKQQFFSNSSHKSRKSLEIKEKFG